MGIFKKIQQWVAERGRLVSPEDVNGILGELRQAKMVVNMLLANKNPTLKRQMNLTGDYAKHRDEAARFVLDNTFHLACAIATMTKHPRILKKFGKTIDAMNKLGSEILAPKPEAKEDGVPTVTEKVEVSLN